VPVIVPVVGVIIRERAVTARWPAPFSLVVPTALVVKAPELKNCFLGIAPTLEDTIVISVIAEIVNALVRHMRPEFLNTTTPLLS
jgi:hypothetical protein